MSEKFINFAAVSIFLGVLGLVYNDNTISIELVMANPFWSLALPFLIALLALLFCIGIGIELWRWRRNRSVYNKIREGK